MKKLLFFLLAIIFAIQGWSQTTLNEGFEGTSFPPDDWRIETTSGGGTWESSTSIAHGGTKSAKSGYYSGGCTRWLITPKLTVTATETNFSFWIACDYWYSDGDNIDVFVSTTDNSTSSFGTTALLALTEDSITTSWAQHTVDLSTFIGQDIYVAIRVTDNFGFSTFIDDVTGPELFVPACPKPTALSASNPTTSGVDLGWTDATGSIWNIQYMLNSETDWANATTITGVTNPYTFATLNGSTTYKARVQTDCGDELSEWSSPISFSTACDVITTFPWSEGFEGDWVSITSPGNRPAPNCWTVVDRGVEDSYYDYFWESNVDMSYSGTSHSGSRHAACYTDYGASDHNDWLISPMISLTGNERLRFWAMRANNSTSEPDEISVYISDDTFTTLDTTGMGQTGNMPGFTQIFTQALPVGDWVQYEINLNQHVGNKYIAFVRQGTPDGYVLRLDDVEISELPTCMRPTNVTVSNITTTDAEVTWTNGNSADAAWWIYYKQTTATTYDSVQVFSNPYTLTTLIPSSGYDIYVATDCGTQLSEASPIVNFRTLCDEISTLPWSDNFDTYGTASGTFPPCWTRPVINSGNPKIVTTNHSAPASLFFQSLTTVPTYAVTPAFTADLNTLMVSFWLKAEGVGSSQSGTITVGVMSNPNDTTTFEAVRLISPSTTDWIEYRIMLAGIQLQGSGNYIAFKHNSNANNWYYWLDDVEVDEIPACPDTYDLTSTILSATSVELDWMDNGNSIGWIIAYGDSTGFDPSTTTQTIVLSSTDPIPYIVSNLTPQTPYSFAVRQNCDGGAWSNIVTKV
ncbi:MAG: choice-of-anchor J domain-containing protein, partial [Desulforegulaceae bacterium]|nr:choice-of-anchor J domain-containing protein [Desulforegulaceae bacterium]